MNKPREADHEIEPLFLNRWSPRAYDGQAMPEVDLLRVLEAARWAPSAYNIQPWRFLYARREDASWDTFVSCLDAFNAGWAHTASALVLVLSDTMSEREDGTLRPARYHSFDTGAAWAQLALQATSQGYQAHAMAGLEFDHARTVLGVPERFRIEIAVAIGRRTDPAVLPAELQEREAPSPRLPIDQIAFAGAFPQ